jgi:hypothetical protein
MAKDTATKKAEQPNELYDSLDETARSVWDLIGSMGYRPDRDDKTLEWYALAMQGDDKIGPKPTLSDLAEAVQAAVPENKDNVIKIKQDSKGQQYLDGQEPELDPELAAAAGDYQAYKIDRVNLQKKESVSKEKLEEVVKRKKHLFKTDPNNSNDKIFEITPDFRIRIGKEWTEKITTETGPVKKKSGLKKAA